MKCPVCRKEMKLLDSANYGFIYECSDCGVIISAKIACLFSENAIKEMLEADR